MSRSIWIVWVTAALLLTATGAVRATSLVPTDLGQLSRQATTIVRGVVAGVETRWTENHRSVETVVTLESEAYLKGSLAPTLQLVIPGGTLGRYRSIVVGMPSFAPGQRVILFLGAHGPSFPHLIGLGQGVFRVSGSVVTPPAMLPPPEGASVTVVRGDVARRTIPLADFERQVRALATGSTP